MDTLALLCNLHADGPETLHRLRTAGWDSLAELSDVEPGELAKALDVTATRAKRFQREAQYLATRLGDDPDSNEGPIFKTGWSETKPEVSVASEGAGKGRTKGKAATPEPSAPTKPTAAAPAETASASKERVDSTAAAGGRAEVDSNCSTDGTGSGAAARGKREPDQASMMDRVLATWREADARQPPQPPGDMIFPAPAKANEPLLTAGEIDGLDANTVSTLAAAGVVRLAQLAEAAALELSNSTKLDFTRLLRLQFLARRKLETLASEARTEPPKATVGRLQRPEAPKQIPLGDDPKMGNPAGIEAANSAPAKPANPTQNPSASTPTRESADPDADFHADGDVAGPFA